MMDNRLHRRSESSVICLSERICETLAGILRRGLEPYLKISEDTLLPFVADSDISFFTADTFRTTKTFFLENPRKPLEKPEETPKSPENESDHLCDRKYIEITVVLLNGRRSPVDILSHHQFYQVFMQDIPLHHFALKYHHHHHQQHLLIIVISFIVVVIDT